MRDTNNFLAGEQPSPEADNNNSFSQYLSFRFYKDNLDQLTEATKDSINNFLKTISEIEDDFVQALHQQRIKNLDLRDLELSGNGSVYMEENY